MKRIVILALFLSLPLLLFACGNEAPAAAGSNISTTTAAAQIAQSETPISTTAAAAANSEQSETTPATTTVLGVSTSANTTTTSIITASVTSSVVQTGGQAFTLNSTNKAEVLALYQKVAAINANLNTTNTKQLIGNLTNESGESGTLAKAIRPIFSAAIQKSSGSESTFPGAPAQLKASDIVSAEAKSSNGITTINIKIKDQTGDRETPKLTGSVGHGLGLLNGKTLAGNLGSNVKLDDSQGSFEIFYHDAVIQVSVSGATGVVRSGIWSSQVRVTGRGLHVKVLVFPETDLPFMRFNVDYVVTA